ncbi:hypothetical protein [Nocardia acidivorans]|uniref:hypothetical protein n=1 Tax=Nocardia acidivorans TaxID=404580 RepID=UPI000A5FD6FB|nr:hypothetical protein [Nocardia acidivorans]
MTATLETPPTPRPARGHRVPWPTAMRFAIVLACTTAAFWKLWLELIEDVRQGSDIGYVFALPVLALFAAIGIALRHRDELPIYDRQSDIIVGLLGLAGTAALEGLLVLRYRYEYEVLHLDLLAAPLFLMSVSILMFGLRPVFRFWPAWLLFLAAFPWVFRGMVVQFGGTKVAQGIAALVFAIAAAAIASGRTRQRALAAALGAVVLGAVVLTVMAVGFPHAPQLAYELIPPITTVFVVCAVMYLYHRDWAHVRPLNRPIRPLTAAQSRAAAVTAVVAAALFALIPMPEDYRLPSLEVPGLIIAHAPAVPPGWTLLGEREYPWASRYYGPDTTWVRQQLRAQRGNPEWDKDSRRRRIMVDVVRSDSPHNVDKYPEFTMYKLVQPRVTPGRRVDLGHGVTARLNTVLDDQRLLSWSYLSWNWQGQGGAERVSLIAADNHLPGADFPQPEPWAGSNLNNLLHQFLRGNAVNVDPNNAMDEVDIEVKDGEMLISVGREIVRLGAGG